MNTKTDFKANKNIFLVIILVMGLLLAFSLRAYFTAFLGSVISGKKNEGSGHGILNIIKNIIKDKLSD